MTGPLIILGLVVIVALLALLQVASNRMQRHGGIVLLWRFLTGHPWHGKPITDAGWLRPGTRALTRTGHASRFHHRPRWQRMLWRSGTVAAVIATLFALVVNYAVTVRCLFGFGVAVVLYVVLRVVLAIRRYRHNRAWVRPLHAVVAPMAGIPLPNRPGSWLTVERDRSKAVLELPANWSAPDKERAALAIAAAEKLGMEGAEPTWRLAGPTPRLTLTASYPAPDKVTLADLATAMDTAGPDELVLGLGKRGQPVSVSLAGDSPHIGLSMASGAGKSITARLIAAQLLHRGGLVVVLDIKRISHSWARGLPNVAYAKTAEEIHQTLLLLAREVGRRNEIADEAVDHEGEIRANVGPRILVVAEELNAMQARLKSYWRDIRDSGDPGKSPAADALDEILFTGRQVRCNVLMIGQRLSANAAGGGDARENLAAKIMGRYSASSWKMMAPEFPMPPSSRSPGRVQVVTHSVRECQTGFLTGKEAREYATNGTVATLPRRFGGPVIEGVVTGDPQIASTGADQRFVAITPSPVLQDPGDQLTLREAVTSGLVDRSLSAIQQARHRDPAFPKAVGQRGVAKLYDADALARWAAGIR